MTAFNCPFCHGGLDYVPEFAGQIVACPHCGQHLQMPAMGPPTPPSFAPQLDAGPSINPYRSSVSASRNRGRRGTSLPQTIKYMMLGATGLWLISMFGLFMFFSASTVKTAGRSGYVVDRDGYMHDSGTYNGIALGSSACVGICFPTIPYAIAMIALGVSYFGTKPERR